MIGFRYALRELQRRPGRWLVSLFTVVIAVAAIVAVSSATGTTRKAYQQVFESLAGRADLEVVAHGGGHFDQNVAPRLRELAGVRAVLPVFHRGTIIYAGEKKAKALAVGIPPNEPESLVGLTVSAGRLPTGASEIAMQSSLAESLSLKVDAPVRLLTSRGLRRYIVVGIVDPETAARMRQGGMVLSPLEPLQRAFKAAGQVDALQLYLNSEAQPGSVVSAAARLLPAELSVQVPSSRSGLAEQTLLLAEVSLNMASTLSFTTAVFIVLSVFLMNIGERRRQLAVLRAVGATRGQIMRLVASEALVTGLCGTALGIPIGIYGGSFLIGSMAALLQTSLPVTPDPWRAIVAGVLVGPAICLLASWYPARQAARVSPLEGMRPAVNLEGHTHKRRNAIVGISGLLFAGLITIGTAMAVVPVWAAIVGLVVSLVSLILLIPLVLAPLVNVISYPLNGLLGFEGEMSRRIVLRRITRSTLTIGVLFIAVSAAVGTSNAVFSITDDVRNWYERTVTADFLLRPMMPDMTGQEGVRMNESMRGELAKLPGVERVDALRLIRVDANGQEAMLLARDFGLYDDIPLDMIGGDVDSVGRKLRNGGIVVGSVLAERAKIKPGDTLQVKAGTQSHDFAVAAIATEYNFGGAVAFIDRGLAKKIFQADGVDTFLIKAAPEQAAALQGRLQKLADSQGLLLQSFVELLDLVNSMIAGVTGGLWVLLALGLVVGALGVVNTLTMNVMEQTQEIGMLRAIGMRRGQIVKTVIGQAAILGIIGVATGMISGVVLARSINMTLGTTFGRYVPFAVRPEFLAALVVVGLIVVLLAAIIPARRAAGLNLIQAMRQE